MPKKGVKKQKETTRADTMKMDAHVNKNSVFTLFSERTGGAKLSMLHTRSLAAEHYCPLRHSGI